MASVALCADLIASDLPLFARIEGRSYFLPCLFRPTDLLDENNQSIALSTANGRGWSLSPPIPWSPLDARQSAPLEPPSLEHLGGTDASGRDVAARLVHSLRTAMLLGALSVALSLAAGALVGVAASASPIADLVLGRLVDVMLSFPTFFLLIAMQGVLGAWRSPSLAMVAIAIALVRWPEVARLVRGEALRVRALPHVEAARALGATPFAIAWRHVLPLALGPALAAAALAFTWAILVETGLGFLGFGVPPPTPTFGDLLLQAEEQGLPWWLVAGPSLLVALLLLACQSLADQLTEILEGRRS